MEILQSKEQHNRAGTEPSSLHHAGKEKISREGQEGRKSLKITGKNKY